MSGSGGCIEDTPVLGGWVSDAAGGLLGALEAFGAHHDHVDRVADVPERPPDLNASLGQSTVVRGIRGIRGILSVARPVRIILFRLRRNR
jgi:hypothetical protein